MHLQFVILHICEHVLAILVIIIILNWEALQFDKLEVYKLHVYICQIVNL